MSGLLAVLMTAFVLAIIAALVLSWRYDDDPRTPGARRAHAASVWLVLVLALAMVVEVSR